MGHVRVEMRFAHWEHRGVLLRVEIGPEDLKAWRIMVSQSCNRHQSRGLCVTSSV